MIKKIPFGGYFAIQRRTTGGVFSIGRTRIEAITKAMDLLSITQNAEYNYTRPYQSQKSLYRRA